MAKNKTVDQGAATIDVVYVACKLPNGHVIEFGGESVTLHGAQNTVQGEKGPVIHLTNEYAITPVSRKLWEGWHSQYGQTAICMSETVFALKDMASTIDKAKDQAEVKTGREQMTPADFGEGLEQGKDIR